MVDVGQSSESDGSIEPRKRISMSKFHQITEHTGEHLLRPTA